MYFHVKWPDNAQQACYSPSSVIKKYFTAGKSYPLNDFVHIAEEALNDASERVNAVYGYYCSSAMDQLHSIKMKAKGYEDSENPTVTVIKITDRLEK
jgi:uncharacterized repeat protein (TIGR04042 family)